MIAYSLPYYATIPTFCDTTKLLLRFATVGTIRLSFLKLGARITISCRRVLIAIATACPYQDILGIAYSRIRAIPDSG